LPTFGKRGERGPHNIGLISRDGRVDGMLLADAFDDLEIIDRHALGIRSA
jgi:hypothetical protein